MKKWICSVLLLMGVTGAAQAGLFEKDISTVKYQIEVTSGTTAPGTSTHTIVIDLSDTTKWPHKETREIDIVGLKLFADKVAASTGSVRLGVVNFVNSSTGSVTWFYSKNFNKNVSGTDNDVFLDYQLAPIKTRVEGGTTVTDGTTPYLLSNDKLIGSNLYQTDVNLPSPVGNTAPGRGDIVLNAVNKDAGNSITVTVEIQYYAK